MYFFKAKRAKAGTIRYLKLTTQNCVEWIKQSDPNIALPTLTKAKETIAPIPNNQIHWIHQRRQWKRIKQGIKGVRTSCYNTTKVSPTAPGFGIIGEFLDCRTTSAPSFLPAKTNNLTQPNQSKQATRPLQPQISPSPPSLGTVDKDSKSKQLEL